MALRLTFLLCVECLPEWWGGVIVSRYKFLMFHLPLWQASLETAAEVLEVAATDAGERSGICSLRLWPTSLKHIHTGSENLNQ